MGEEEKEVREVCDRIAPLHRYPYRPRQTGGSVGWVSFERTVVVVVVDEYYYAMTTTMMMMIQT